jgi:hypothetical protein
LQCKSDAACARTRRKKADLGQARDRRAVHEFQFPE